jgi:hypothetical protein
MKDRTQHSEVVLVMICVHSESFDIPLNARPCTEKATKMKSIPNGIRQSYDAKLKLTVINCAKKNSSNTARKFSTVEVNVRRWKEQKQMINVNSTRKSFNDPKQGYFQQSEQEIVKFVCLK